MHTGSVSRVCAQKFDSRSLFVGTNVTNSIDPAWGLEVKTWDISLKLTYAIDVVGGDQVLEGYYLNQGSLGICNDPGAKKVAKYCEFERFFEDDVSRALNIKFYRVQVLFVKSASLDSVLVHFRIMPPHRNSTESSVTLAIAQLAVQVTDPSSELYKGNVTIRTDPTWGVSNTLTTARSKAAQFTLDYYEYSDQRLNSPKRLSQITAYDRCKANRRCNWGIVEHDQFTNDARFFQRLFDNGELYETNLFLDFEDWRMGSRGFSWNGYIPPSLLGSTSAAKARAVAVTDVGGIRGAHFWPFDQPSLGPDIPCYRTERNQGLVLDRALQRTQIDAQEALVDDLLGRIDWLGDNIEVATMGPVLRSRKDVRANLTWVQADIADWWSNENTELKELSSSQCVKESCEITFDTSTLMLTGAIRAKGTIKTTDSGTEVAVFTFNSIYLGPETRVNLIGQRALSLVSKTTAVINTTIEATPGTLGGFRGGGSVGRFANESLSDDPVVIPICELGKYCVDSTISDRVAASNLSSNNVNGPGSGNLRVHAFMIETSALYFPEIQYITTTAQQGQTLSGGFVLGFQNYSTPIIPHDATPLQLKRVIEENLNAVSPANAPVYPDRADGLPAGVGIVTVTRSPQDGQEGYTWSITFNSAIGNIDQLTVKSFLFALQSKIVVGTTQDGNEITGTFRLKFQDSYTEPISADETAAGLKAILTQLPAVSTAVVSRIDPTQNCDDGLCPNGPFPCRGMLWTVYVTADASYGDITPTSPTSSKALTEGAHFVFTSEFQDTLKGNESIVSIYQGTSRSLESPSNLLNVVIPFSLAFGGGGGSYGGLGGVGYGINPVGPVYNDRLVTDLFGGSGGCMSSSDLYAINSVLGATAGSGGHGGGAIEIVASNDVVIGSYGKLMVRGGVAGSTAEGGGGGGSGGAVLLSSGSTILMEGTIDASGGDGGFGGFLHLDLAGGGGGGGRVALYADSISVTGSLSAEGGDCGVYYAVVPTDSVEVKATLYLAMYSPLDDARVKSLTSQYLSVLLSNPQSINATKVSRATKSGVIFASVEISILFTYFDDSSPSRNATSHAFNTTHGVNLAEVILLNTTMHSFERVTSYPQIRTPSETCSNRGSSGSLYTEAMMTTSMYVRPTVAAESTKRALFMSNRENTNTSSGSAREVPFSGNGPIVPFEASQPARITYYTRIDSVAEVSNKVDYGSLFSLISRGEAGLNVSSVIGVYFGGAIMHGANFGSAVDEKVFLKRLVTIDPYPILDRWYKIDIYIQWVNHTYSVAIDDTISVTAQSFTGDDVDGIRLSVYRAVDVWFDEVYVGFDNTMEFKCPVTLRTGTSTAAPVQKAWSFEEVHGGDSNGYTEYNTMTRHYNFLDTVGSIPFDGQGEIRDYQDIKLQYADGDYPLTQGMVHAGALVYLTNSLRSAKTPLTQSYTLVSPNGLWSGAQDGPGGAGDGRQFWYTDYSYNSDISPVLNGGVATCSSQDLVTWRFEGIVFHYTNLTDMVFGNSGPFYLERPKVLFNANTSNYVMWAVMDNSSRHLAMSAIATSPYEDGPFLFRRSFYPDGNTTRDQVIFLNDQSLPVVARTYYQTVEFLLPEAMMQPTWESAKSRTGEINYRSNYHRAWYHIGYDNFNDIYAQRWRKEDVAYKVQCKNKITGAVRSQPSGQYNADGFVCDDPSETKIIVGQGDPIITSRFVSPNDSENSWWRPTSVPAVEAQAWSNNYQDGYCGIRKLNDDFAVDDPNLAEFTPVDRSTCSNIADNPVHESMQDKLIGVMHVIVTRRAKFVAVSQLTYDFLDTCGWLSAFEGEMETGDLISLIMESGQLGFGAGELIQSTFAPPVRSDYETAIDYNTRFSQYIRNHNDRASYSLACVLDGICPVNFKAQLTSGQF
eukprot:gene21395-27425_t